MFHIQKLENEGRGCNSIDSATLENHIKTASALTDDAYFWTNGANFEKMMNSMMEEHATLHETVEGKRSRKICIFRLVMAHE